MKKALTKIAEGAVKVWRFLDGKKRYITSVAGAVVLVAPEYTLAYKIAVVTGAVFGVAGGAQQLNKRLPGGIRKGNNGGL